MRPVYRALFADDEIIIREGIQSIVDWRSHGFELVKVCVNGEDVRDFLNNNGPVDMILTDICMPRMDGLRLSKYVSEAFPHTRILLLTGYDDFEYAQEAIKYNVTELLLKPISVESLGAVLNKVRALLDEDRRRAAEHEELQKKLAESLPLLRERFLNRLVKRSVAPEQMAGSLKLYQLPPLNQYIRIVVTDTAPAEQDRTEPPAAMEMRNMYIRELFEREIRERDFVFSNPEEQIVVIMQQDNEASLDRRSLELCRKIRDSANQTYGMSISFGLGRIVTSFEEVPSSYNDAMGALAHRYLMGRNRIIFFSDIENLGQAFAVERRQLEQSMVRSLRIDPPERVHELVKEFFKILRESPPSLLSARIQINLFFGSVLRFLETAGIDPMNMFMPGQNGFQELSECATLDEEEAWFHRFITTIHTRLEQARNDYVACRIERAKQLITENFGNPAFSISETAAMLHVSPSHFSAQFKQVTGKTFVEYLTEYRIRQAQMFLKTTNLLAYEVSEKVGYTDPHYFSQIFKRVTGTTVRDYRMSLNREQ